MAYTTTQTGSGVHGTEILLWVNPRWMNSAHKHDKPGSDPWAYLSVLAVKRWWKGTGLNWYWEASSGPLLPVFVSPSWHLSLSKGYRGASLERERAHTASSSPWVGALLDGDFPILQLASSTLYRPCWTVETTSHRHTDTASRNCSVVTKVKEKLSQI